MPSDYFSVPSITNASYAAQGHSSRKARPAQAEFGQVVFGEGVYPLPPNGMMPPLYGWPPASDVVQVLPMASANSGPSQKQSGFLGQLFTLKGLLYSAALVLASAGLGRHFGGKAFQAELKVLKQKTGSLESALKAKSAVVKPEAPKPVVSSPKKPQASAGIQTDVPVKPDVREQAVQTLPTPKPKIGVPDWTNFWHQYETTQGELSWQITRLYNRQGSLPKPLGDKAIDLMNTTQRYRMTYDTAEADKDLIAAVSGMGESANTTNAELVNSKAAVELRARIPSLRHFIRHTRNTLQEFQTYQQQNGSGLSWALRGISRYDREILQQIEQKLNAYEATVDELHQAIKLPSKS